MDDLYELNFRWPRTDATDVIVTGTFDQWSSSIHLQKTSTGFEGSAKVPYLEKGLFKYVVDGRWTITDDQPSETDSSGNVNNVYQAPARPPVQPKAEAPPAALPSEVVDPVLKDTQPEPAKTVGDKVIEVADTVHTNVIAPATASVAATVERVEVPKASDVTEAVKSVLPSAKEEAPVNGTTLTASVIPAKDVASTILATDGVTGPLQYVASGVGAAIHSAIGIDPINGSQIPVQTPKVEEIPEVPSPIVEKAPEVPIEITPVNVPEVSTVAVPEVTAEQPEPASTHTPVIPATAQLASPPVPETAVTEVTTPSDPTPEVTTSAVATPPAVTPPVAASQSVSGVNGLNGTKGTKTPEASKDVTPTATPTPSAPSTPTKKSAHEFPRRPSESPSATDTSRRSSIRGSPGSLRMNSVRKKRDSIFGKLRGIFSHEKEGSKEKAEK